MTGSEAAPRLARNGSPARLASASTLEWLAGQCKADPHADDANATQEPAALTNESRSSLETGDLDAIRDLLVSGVRWGAPKGPNDADCHNRDHILAWWTSASRRGTSGGH
jgi:hypothetical protein